MQLPDLSSSHIRVFNLPFRNLLQQSQGSGPYAWPARAEGSLSPSPVPFLARGAFSWDRRENVVLPKTGLVSSQRDGVCRDKPPCTQFLPVHSLLQLTARCKKHTCEEVARSRSRCSLQSPKALHRSWRSSLNLSEAFSLDRRQELAGEEGRRGRVLQRCVARRRFCPGCCVQPLCSCAGATAVPLINRRVCFCQADSAAREGPETPPGYPGIAARSC